MNTTANPLACGNAARIYFNPGFPFDAARVLRKADDTFTGHDDTSATLVFAGKGEACLDLTCRNGSTYFYKPYFLSGGLWSAGTSVSVTPQFAFADQSTDVQSLVRERLDLGLVAYAQTIPHETGKIPVLTASPMLEEVRLPVVTIHLSSLAPDTRGVGEGLAPPFDGESYLSRWQIEIIGWTLNADERKALRAAIHATLMANFPVFDDAGMVLCQFDFSDLDDFNSYDAPLFTTRCLFQCLAPSVVAETSATPAIARIDVII